MATSSDAMRIVVRDRPDDPATVEIHAYTSAGVKLVPAGKDHDRFADPGYGPFAVAGPHTAEPTLILPRELYAALSRGGADG